MICCRLYASATGHAIFLWFWFGAYAESLVDDLITLQAAYEVVNKNPLGSAAGYGSSFPINRKMTTELLGFDDLNYNVVYAQMGRGKTETDSCIGPGQYCRHTF